jgi:hypothetical protein
LAVLTRDSERVKTSAIDNVWAKAASFEELE